MCAGLPASGDASSSPFLGQQSLFLQAMAFEALKADVGRQVQAPRPRALGKSAAEGPNDRLQADLIDFSQNTRGKTRYGLVVMDVFTREAAVAHCGIYNFDKCYQWN